MRLEVVLTAHTEWWLRLLNFLGADMVWTHALLRFDDEIIEAVDAGVIKRPWDPSGWERYARFQVREGYLTESAAQSMRDFAEGEVGKRYAYEKLPLILLRILKRITSGQVRGALAAWLIVGTGEVCTSLVDRVFLHAALDVVPSTDSPFVLPDDIAVSPLLEAAT